MIEGREHDEKVLWNMFVDGLVSFIKLTPCAEEPEDKMFKSSSLREG